MAAAVLHRDVRLALLPDEVKHPPLILRRQHEIRMFLRAAYRLQADDAPGVEVHFLKDLIEPVQLLHVLMIQDGRDLDRPESAFVDQILNALHRPLPSAGQPPQPVMGLRKAVNADGDGPHPRFSQLPRHIAGDEGGI